MSQGRSAGTSRATNNSSVAMLLGIGGAVLLLLFVLASYSVPPGDVSGVYGKRRGSGGAAQSVNGTSVLASMFERAGHRVTSIHKLNRSIEKFDVIVWFPDSFQVPSQNARDFLETWVYAKPNRTLVYIGRDYDALPDYWSQIVKSAPPTRQADYERREALARSEADTKRLAMPLTEPCEWFTMKAELPSRKIDSLDGPWASGVDAAKCEIHLKGRLDIPDPEDGATADFERPEVDILLQSENDILAHRVAQSWWNGSSVIVVANGSFTLNMPLVNHENRKLAGRLIDSSCGQSGGKSVAFLETGEFIVVDTRKGRGDSLSALRLLTEWPISFMLIHFAALGIACCIALSPIFGRAKHLPPQVTADFGQHVKAIGSHLARTKDAAYARTKIDQYHTIAKRKSGRSHRLDAPSPPSASPPPTKQQL
jgi:hypothetical protein